ncbi:MAG: hypothetical protein H6745_19650 [Deltaproteobacteria bacterium]|nr:hypothetical protein [Deltaproteobacteria bacterium]
MTTASRGGDTQVQHGAPAGCGVGAARREPSAMVASGHAVSSPGRRG